MSEGSDDPAVVLGRLHAHFDYYLAVGARVSIETEAQAFSFDVVAVEPRRKGEFPSSHEPGRRFFECGQGRLYVDSASKQGRVTESEPYLDDPGEAPDPVEAVAIETGVEVTHD